VSTAPSSAEPRPLRGSVTEARRAAADVAALFRFRVATLRGRARLAAPVALVALALVTLGAGLAPATFPDVNGARLDVRILLPAAYLSVLVVSVVSATTSAGGRELLPRDQAVAFPVSATTDHLGALLMAPFNLAWLVQCWTVLAATSYAVGDRPTLVLALLPVLVWMAAATALAQLLAWGVEWVRRGPHGLFVVRGVAVLLAGAAAWSLDAGRLTRILDHSPTVPIAAGVTAGAAGHWAPWLGLMAVLLLLAGSTVVLGAWAAGRTARRQPRDEVRAETAVRRARSNPTSDLHALVRIDRASIWRSVPMRRGMVVLTVLPGLIALGGAFGWDQLGMLPGLVATGGALLFGVNSWCLDGRGALWRESVPASPGLGFSARVLVLGEVLLSAIAATLVLASLRAGLPTVSQLVSLVCVAAVVSAQVVVTSMRWSVRHPYAAELRSARDAPAPPLAMVGYAARLAFATTCAGLVFNVSSRLPWACSLVLCASYLMWSGLRLRRSAVAWQEPETRSAVIATVAA
jgi:hypothetical protein